MPIFATTLMLLPGVKAVCRQQLSDPEFYQAVKADLLNGDLILLDQGIDSVMIGVDTHKLTEPVAMEALAESQETWVGVPPKNRFIGGLISQAERLQLAEVNWQGVKSVTPN